MDDHTGSLELAERVRRAVPFLAAGAIVGIACYWGYVVLWDLIVTPKLVQPGAPIRSCGQPFGIVMTPLAAALGAAAALSVHFACRSASLAGAALSLCVAILIALMVVLLWADSVARYGYDPTDWLLFVPLLVGSSFVFLEGAIIGVSAIAQRGFRR